MAEQYIVHYFDLRGRAEPIRMILSYAGANWKDQRIPYSFPSVIPSEIKAGEYKVINNTGCCGTFLQLIPYLNMN